MSSKLDVPGAAGVARTLSQEFQNEFPLGAIEHIVSESLGSFTSARVREFVPLLVYRITRERLLDLRMRSQVVNSGRSA